MSNWIHSIFKGVATIIISGLTIIGVGVKTSDTQKISTTTPSIQVGTTTTSSEVSELQLALEQERSARLGLEKKIDSINQQQASILEKSKEAETPTTTANVVNTQIAPQATLNSKQIVDLVSPSVVMIATQLGAGSGFVINNGKYILTNAHVVGSSQYVNVYKSTGGYFTAPVLGINTTFDLALIWSGGQNLKAITLGSSDPADLSIGDSVYTLGYPLSITEGLTNITVTEGIISARQTPNDLGTAQQLLQTDAAINHGNSGGPLVNSKGEVVGINTYTDASIYNQTQGIYFAIPIDTAKDYISPMSQYGQSRYEAYPIGSTYNISQSVLLRMQLNPKLTCSALDLSGDDLFSCEYYRNYPNDYNWNVIKDQ